MTKQKSVSVLCLCLLAAFFISCTQQRDPCLQPKVMTLRMHAYRIADTVAVDTALPFPLVAAIDFDDSIKATAYGNKNIGTFSVYLSPLADSCRWLIVPDSTAGSLGDTLTFHYTKSLQFLSTACGYAYFYNLQNVHTTTHSIDSAIIITYDVNADANKEHLKIYY